MISHRSHYKMHSLQLMDLMILMAPVQLEIFYDSAPIQKQQRFSLTGDKQHIGSVLTQNSNTGVLFPHLVLSCSGSRLGLFCVTMLFLFHHSLSWTGQCLKALWGHFLKILPQMHNGRQQNSSMCHFPSSLQNYCRDNVAKSYIQNKWNNCQLKFKSLTVTAE